MNNSICLLISSAFASLCILLSPQVSHSEPTWDELRGYLPHSWDLQFKLHHYTALANYRSSGNTFDRLPDGNSYSNTELEISTRYTPSFKTGIWFGGIFGFAKSKSPQLDRENSGVSSLVAGFDYLLMDKKRFELIPEITVVYPMKRVDPSSQEVLNGEGAIEIAPRMILRTAFGPVATYTHLGINYKDEGRATLLTGGLGGEFGFQTFFVGSELRGYGTISNDKDTATRATKEAYASRNGGALRYYAVNPSLVDLNFWARIDRGRNYGFQIGGGTSLLGQSTSAGWQVFVKLNYRFQKSNELYKRYQYQPLMPVNKEVEAFKESTQDDVDQNLFKPKPVQKKSTQKKRARPLTAEEKRRLLEKELKQTEEEIELRNIRNKNSSDEDSQ